MVRLSLSQHFNHAMANYNFYIKNNRENSSCVKYDLRKEIFGNADVIPMWVADMDIQTPDFIFEAIRNRCTHPFLGYSFRDESYNLAITEWYKRRHGWNVQSDWIEFCPGVVSGLNHVIRALTKPGDKIIIQPPVYHPFFSTVENNGRVLVNNPLIESNGNYSMNFGELERLAAQGASMLILSNPHNPVGRVWNLNELTQLGDICVKHNVLVVADEIHCDLVYKAYKHIPLASINSNFAKNTITFSSASKTFNIAGLASGFVIISNPDMMKKYKHELEETGAGMGNIFGNEAVKAAFSLEGEEWLTELLQYFEGNVDLVERTLKQHLPKLKFTKPQGTYLLWLDFREFEMNDEALNKKLINEVGLGLNAGNGFGAEGTGFQRMNIACPRSVVQIALNKLIDSFKNC